ncbi:MAG: SPFH/Band 7/PHB domain protein [Proteobacteria bacterium]|nr:SPFH/Band 7/PHB domain protein [Pseudomonadota bacterium]NBP15249.1 SPFH/Band 7/PHB domain protein [bacterium]
MIFELSLFLFGIIFLVFIVFLMKAVYLVNQSEAIVIQRLGRFHRILAPGLHFVIPFVDAAHVCFWTFVTHNEYGKYIRFVRVMRKIDLRESVYDFPKQNVITKDNVNIEINALLYYQITDPKAAVYEVSNLPEAIEKLTQTTLRNVIGSMDLDETLVSRDFINGKLQVILDEATDKWGVKINRVELQEVNPPRDIQVAMEKQMRAERDRRAIILESEGEKRAAILKAEGDRESRVLKAQGIAESTILEAEGQAQARLKIIQAEAQALELIQKAIPGKDPLAYMIAQEYIKTLPEILKDATGKTILFPYESSGLMGSLSTIKTLFQEQK